MFTRVAAALTTAVGATALLPAAPAGAAVPHDLSRTDHYTVQGPRSTLGPCTITGQNVLTEDGTGSVRVENTGKGLCNDAEVTIRVSYVEADGDEVSFSVSGRGYSSATLHDVGSGLAIEYLATSYWCICSSPTYSLPK